MHCSGATARAWYEEIDEGLRIYAFRFRISKAKCFSNFDIRVLHEGQTSEHFVIRVLPADEIHLAILSLCRAILDTGEIFS
jgi:hypothetical protein